MCNTLRGVAGPDAGWAVRLDPGGHWLGRAAGGVQVFDPMIEAHHAHLDVDDDGSVTLLQTSGRVPLLVDGDPVDGPTSLSDGSAVEIGASRIEVGSMATSMPPAGSVRAPQDDTCTERDRFSRDVAAAAAVRDRHVVAERPLTVTIGVAELALEIDIRNRNGEEVAIGDLPHHAQSVVDRACRRVVPVRVELSAVVPVLIVAPDPVVVADAITAQIDAPDRARVSVGPADDTESLAGARRPLLALARSDDQSVEDDGGIPAGYRAVLRVSPTWRATWQADVPGHLGRIVQLHARGRSPRRLARTSGHPMPTGRSSLSR